MSIDVTVEMQQLLSSLPRTDTPELNSHYTPEYGVREAILAVTPANILLALMRAREAQKLAVSWRGFKVGAAVVATSLGKSRFEIMTGVNVKPDEDSAMNVHAEQAALQKVDDRGYQKVAIVAVVGETQNDTQSGHDMPTLHPCGLCRNVLRESPKVDAESTLVVSALPTLRTIQTYSLNQLLQYHDDPSSIELARFDLPDMQLLRPCTVKGQEAIRLEDTPQNLEEEVVWNRTIGVMSLAWRRRHLEVLGHTTTY